MRRGLLLAVLLFATTARAGLIESITCKNAPDQSYALYVPTSYDPAKPAPIVYLLDARGRALVPLSVFEEAAEQLGFIVASSYNSASDETIDPNVTAMRAMWTDTHANLKIDDRRVYAAGFSGTVRAAIYLALGAPGSLAAVIGAGAGFPFDKPPTNTTPFVFFGTIGTRDFNYGEMWDLEKRLTATRVAHRIVQFEGTHEWMPPALAREALQWLVTRSGDAKFWFEDLIRAEKATDVIERQQRYASMARDYAGIHDTSLVSARAKIIGESKEYRDAVDGRDRVVRDEFAYLAAAQKTFAAKAPFDAKRAIAELKIDELRARKDDSAKRILSTLAAQAGFYLPRDMMRRREYERAVFFLTIAKAVNPDSKYIDDQLAIARGQLSAR
jgi:predicted esterase